MEAVKTFQKGAKKTMIGALVATIFMIIVFPTIYVSVRQPVLALIMILALAFTLIFFFVNLSIYIRSFEIDKAGKVLYWKFPNGDELLVSKRYIFSNFTSIEEHETNKDLGWNWGMDNVKDGVEELINEGNPLKAMIPSLTYKVDSDKMPEVIHFNGKTTVHFTLLQYEGEQVLMVSVWTNWTTNSTVNYHFSCPAPKEGKFGKERLIDMRKRLKSGKVKVKVFMKRVTREEMENLVKGAETNFKASIGLSGLLPW